MMKGLKSQQLIRKNTINTPNSQSGYASRKNTQVVASGSTKEDSTPQKRSSQNSQSQFSSSAQAIYLNEQQSVQQYQASSNVNSRIDYRNIDQNDSNQVKNGRTPDYPRSQTNLDNYEIQQKQRVLSQYNQTQNDQNLKTLKSIRQEAKLQDSTQRDISNIEFNFSFVDNLISKRGFAQEKVVPMQLFQEIMQYFEKRFIDIEQRIEDNEQTTHLSDRLLELRYFDPNIQKLKSTYNQSPYHYQKQMNQSGIANSRQIDWNRSNISQDLIPNSFRSEQNQKYTTSASNGVYSALSKQINNRLDLFGYNSDKNNKFGQNVNNHIQTDFYASFNNQTGNDLKNSKSDNNSKIIQNGNDNFIDLSDKISNVENRISQFDDFAKTLAQDIEKKFTDYDKFFKSASQKMEQYGEKDQKLQNIQDTIQQQLDVLNQTYILKQEELIINKEEINDNIKTISALNSKLENRINEHSIDIEENRGLIKGIEDDLFVMLQSYKELAEGVQNYRSLSDDIGYLKQNQANILKNINVNAIHFIQN